jgi:hypothetical protein
VIKKEAEKILKCKDLTVEILVQHVECKNTSDTDNNTDSWKHLQII